MNSKKIQKLEKIKEEIGNLSLPQDQKSSSFKHIEEWYAQDQSFGVLYEKLAQISPKIEALLAEMGLI